MPVVPASVQRAAGAAPEQAAPEQADQVGPRRRWRLLRWLPGRVLAALLAGATSLAVYSWQIGRPAFWQDEAFTVILTRRNWFQLSRLIFFTDAPLGPYYVLMKPWLEIDHGAGWARLPSAVALAVVVALVVRLAWTVTSRTTAAATAVVLIVVPSLSRFAQETRPYGLSVLAVTLCTLAWWGWLRRGGRRRGLLFAFAVALVPLTHLLALSVVLAQLLATWLAWPAGGRAGLHRALRAACWAMLGLLMVSPFCLLAVKRASGVAHPRPFGLANVWLTVCDAFLTEPVALLAIALAVLGAISLGLSLRRAGGPVPEPFELTGDAARRLLLGYALAWALLPPVLMSLAAALGQKTLIGRYELVSLPGWALLAGEGCTLLAVLVTRLVRLRAIGLAVAVAPLVALAVLGWPAQQEMRRSDGHSDGDVRPAVALLRRPDNQDVAIVVPKASMQPPLLAYGPDLVVRMPLYRDPEPGAHLVMSNRGGRVAGSRLRQYDRIAMVSKSNLQSAQKFALYLPNHQYLHVDSRWTGGGWSIVILSWYYPPGVTP